MNYLNDLLGNAGLYDWSAAEPAACRLKEDGRLLALVARMKAGTVGSSSTSTQTPSIISRRCSGTPMPSRGSRWQSAWGIGRRDGQLCTYILPINNQLESWGDHAQAGVHSFQQPVIAPLYDTRQKEAVLLRWMMPDTAFV